MIYNELTRQVQESNLDDYEVNFLYQLIWNVSSHIFRNGQSMKERVGRVMGGQVLKFDWDIEYRKQMQEVRAEGGIRSNDLKMLSLIYHKLKKANRLTL